MILREHEPLSSHTTFRVGGTARFYSTASTAEDIQEVEAFAKEKGIPTVILGGGSNTLADDGEAEALYFRPSLRGLSFEDDGDTVTMVVASGESWDQSVLAATERNLWGIENLSGIPGSVGGAVVQNIGAYGAALSDTLRWVEVFDRRDATVKRLTSTECEFGYRDSLFKKEETPYIILRCAIALSRKGTPNVGYRDLAEHFGREVASVREVRDGVLLIRAKKFPDLSFEGTAGSFFKNHIVSPEEGEKLKSRYPEMPIFIMPETSGVKVPVAWILDHVLSMRGFAMGHVRCFEQQPLVLVAQAGATAADVRALARVVRDRVRDASGIELQHEVRVMRGVQASETLDF